MAVTFNTYTGLQSAVPTWRARVGDTFLADNFDNFLNNAEQRIWYGHSIDQPGSPMHSPALRIPEMEIGAVSSSVVDGTVAQPVGFLELISAYYDGSNHPLQIVAQRVIDDYGTQGVGGTKLIAVSGTNFRFYDAPSSGTVTIRYYQKLPTPTPAESNAILTNYPALYLYACLLEACIMEQDDAAAAQYLMLYNAVAAGLNVRHQRITASANPVLRVRATTP